jgi:hypothetical protein
VQAGRLDELRGFGPKTAENIMHGVEILRHGAGRVHLDVALSAAEQIVGVISAVPGCTGCAYAGSLRRFRETIGDVDVLAAADDPKPLMRALKAMPDVADVIASGPTKTSIRTTAGLQVDLRVVPPESWGAALQYFTGSKAHNVGVRTIAVRAGLKLSEYGLFDAETDELIVSRTEEELYERLGLQWVPPPLREDRGEIAAAQEGTVPAVVTERDIRGDLHTHTNLTDGVAPLAEMVEAAAARGYAYFAITDHAPNLYMQQMSTDKMLEQRAQVRELNRAYRRLRLLHGTELNIDPDGGVDWADDILAGFDVCVASVHSHFNQAADAMTRRLITACENPYPHHRPPDDPDPRAPRAGGGGLGRGLPGGGPDRDRARDQRLAQPPRPERRAHPRGPRGRGEVRREHRRARGPAPGQPQVRRRHRAARLAHPRRRHQHLAVAAAAGVPAREGARLRRPAARPRPPHCRRVPDRRRSGQRQRHLAGASAVDDALVQVAALLLGRAGHRAAGDRVPVGRAAVLRGDDGLAVGPGRVDVDFPAEHARLVGADSGVPGEYAGRRPRCPVHGRSPRGESRWCLES